VREDVDSAVQRGAGTGAVRRVRHHEFAALVSRGCGGPDDVDGHHDDGCLCRPGSREELDDVRIAVQKLRD
jgi:hypothetical protein